MDSCIYAMPAAPAPSTHLLEVLISWKKSLSPTRRRWQPMACASPAPPKQRSEDASAAYALTDLEHTQKLERLYGMLEVPLTNVLYRWLWDREEVRDLVQESFLRLWRMRKKLDWSRAKPLVFKIALNLAASRRRSIALRRFVGMEAAESTENGISAPDSLAQEQSEEALRQAINTLSERHRRVLMLTEFTDLSYEQIAMTLEISLGTVGSRRNTAIKKLKATMQRWERSL